MLIFPPTFSNLSLPCLKFPKCSQILKVQTSKFLLALKAPISLSSLFLVPPSATALS